MRRVWVLPVVCLALFLYIRPAHGGEKIYIHHPQEAHGPYVVIQNYSWDLNKISKEIWGRMTRLIVTHPKVEIRKDLRRLIEKKTVSVAISSDEQIYKLSDGYYYSNQIPLQVLQLSNGSDADGIRLELRVSIPFMLGYNAKFGELDHQYFLQLALWHEYRHIIQNRDGRFLPDITMQKLNTNTCAGARLVWEGEWEAYSDQWVLAKEIDVTHVMPHYEREIKKWGEKRGMLEAFAGMLMKDYTRDDEVRSCWVSILEEKRQKIGAK